MTISIEKKLIPIRKIKYEWEKMHDAIFGGKHYEYYHYVDVVNEMNFNIICRKNNKDIVVFRNSVCFAKCGHDDLIECCQKDNRFCKDSKKIFQECYKNMIKCFKDSIKDLSKTDKIVAFYEYGGLYIEPEQYDEQDMIDIINFLSGQE